MKVEITKVIGESAKSGAVAGFVSNIGNKSSTVKY